MRLSKEVVTNRENRIRALFTEGKSVKEANDILKAETGKAMNLKRVYELRTEVSGGTTNTDTETTVSEVVNTIVASAEETVDAEVSLAV